METLLQDVRYGLRMLRKNPGFTVLISLSASRFLAALLVDTSPNDPTTFASISILLAGVAALAGYLPARRATRTDPMIALRCE